MTVEPLKNARPLRLADRVFLWLAGHPVLVPANFIGEPISKAEDENGIGILFKDPGVRPVTWLSWILGIQPRRVFLGNLYFWSAKHEHGDWHFQLNGDRYRIIALLIADELRQKFGADVRIDLIGHDTVLEHLPVDPD